MPSHTSIEYAEFVITKLRCLAEIPSVSRLLVLGFEEPETDSDRESLDNAVMQAIWDIRSVKPTSAQGERLRRLLSDQYELLPKTKAYLEWYKPNHSTWDTPFRYDGLKWNDTCFNMWYYNAFDHAITYHITRGWGLSDRYTNDGTIYPYNDKVTGYDASIWLATVEALSLQQVISADDIPDNVIEDDRWGKCKSVDELTRSQRDKIKNSIRDEARKLLDKAIGNSKDH